MSNGFMTLATHAGPWYVVETTAGTEVVPVDAVGFDLVPGDASPADLATYCEGTPLSVEVRDGFCARFSADGYLDATGWCGPYKTALEAERACMRQEDMCRHGYDRDGYACVGGDHHERQV